MAHAVGSHGVAKIEAAEGYERQEPEYADAQQESPALYGHGAYHDAQPESYAADVDQTVRGECPRPSKCPIDVKTVAEQDNTEQGGLSNEPVCESLARRLRWRRRRRRCL